MSDLGVPGTTTVTCPHCGAQNDASARHCDRCGETLVGPSAGADADVLELVEAERAAVAAGFEDAATLDGDRAICPECGTPNDIGSLIGSGRRAQDAATNRDELEVVAFTCGRCGDPAYVVWDHEEEPAGGGDAEGPLRMGDERLDDAGQADRHDLYPHSTPVSDASFEDEVDRFEPAGPGTLADQGDLLDEQGEDRRQYTGEPVETDAGWVVPVQQNFAGRDNIAGGGEWPDPHAEPAQPRPPESDPDDAPGPDASAPGVGRAGSDDGRDDRPEDRDGPDVVSPEEGAAHDADEQDRPG